MPQFEYEFSDKDFQLVATQDIGGFGGMDYIRLTIYPTEAIDDIVTLTDSTKGINGQAIFFASLNPEFFRINVSAFNGGLDEIRTKVIGGPVNGDFRIYQNAGDSSIYIKPNEIFNTFELPQGSYKVQIDFLNQVKTAEFVDGSTPNEHYRFITKQISTSRKEVRLKLSNKALVKDSIEISDLTNQFNFNEPEFLEDTDEASDTFGQFVIPNPNYKYQFKHVLNIGTGDHIPIMNYQFDRVTNGRNNQSLILKLYEPLPTNIGNLSLVTIEREVLTTQIEETYYFSDVAPIFFGDGLVPDSQENWINPDGNESQFQNFDELTGSLDNITIDNLISQSQYDYPNLNTDFNKFENHTFFGSAKRKLENFRKKVETIQGHYSEISKSLFASGSTATTTSDELIQQRKNLFKKVNDEIKTFSPYERFLYYGGQNESTSSAPGLGKNYADTIPVQTIDYQGQINGGDGFNVVYHHSNKDRGTDKFIGLFTNKYFAKNKPFFNYSGSIYLSFLMKGDSGSAITWENRNKSGVASNGVSFPQDALNQTTLESPNITSSEYRRYIFRASQSFWVPSAEVPEFDLSNMEQSDFNAGSTKVQLLSGKVKTGSNVIKDSSNLYQNYTSVVTASGVSFTGSVMPAAELFRIFTITELSSSLAGYYRFDEPSGSLCEDASGNGFSGSLKVIGAGGLDGGGIRVSGSLSDGGRQSSGSAAGNGAMFFGETGSAFVQITSSLIPDSELATTDFSITAWIMPTSQSQEFDTIVAKRDSEANGFQLDIRDANSDTDNKHPFSLGFALQASGSGAIATQGTTTIPTGSYTHVAVVVDRSDKYHLYINGIKNISSADISARGSGITGSGAFDTPFGIGGKISQTGAGSNKFGGYIDEVRVYKRVLKPTEVKQLYNNPSGDINTKITDVKVTFEDPSNVLPFDMLYHTSSTEWQNWYSGSLDSASAFDKDNIHSFENNLPLYIQDSNDYDDMKDFLALQGEQYDLIRNHIDSMGTLHDRGYDKLNSPPDNTLPMLLSNMGWEAINPFSGSLTETLGNYLSGVTSIDDIKNQTWRKTLNNLIYIYKSKGTKNSVRALLNTYGYPPDLLQFREFGGITEELTGDFNIIPDEPPNPDKDVIEVVPDVDLEKISGSVGYVITKEKLYRYMFSNQFQQERILNLDWYMDDANINTFEFVYKHKQTTNTQTILKSSGSGNQHLWDLRLVPSADGLSSSFEFRLNNSQRGGTAIGSRGFSMSSAYNQMTDGQLWNVMLQRMTGSVVDAGTQEYRLHAALQQEFRIKPYSFMTMSISGGLVGDSTLGGKGFFANQNFIGSGSRHPLSSSNLFVGETLSGSLAEIRGWTTALSASKFRLHTLNKFSTVGNNVSSYEEDLVYHFKLNENYSSASVSSSNQLLTIVDSAPKCSALLTTDYSFQKTGSFFTGSIVYGFDIIDVVRFELGDNIDKQNDNHIFINPNTSLNADLSPYQNGFINPPSEQPQILNSLDLTIAKSPQDFVDKHILNNLSGFNFEKFYGNPLYYHSQSYDEFDDLRKDFFKCNPIEVDTNAFIRAHEDMVNNSIVEGLKTVVPARSTFSDKNSNFGVEIRPNLLEKQKYENEEQDVEANPNTFTSSIVIVSTESIMTGSKLENPKSGSINIITPETIMSGSENVLPKSASINVIIPETIMSGSENVLPKSASIAVVVPETIMSGSTLVLPFSGSIDYSAHSNKSFVNIHDSWGTGATDTHFINFAGGTGSNGDYNVGHIDTRNHFYSIGDSEYYSASYGSGSSDFTNINRFGSHHQVTEGPAGNVTYTHLRSTNPLTFIGHLVSNRKTDTGQRMGKTRFMRLVKNLDNINRNEQLVLPRNHITNFSNPFKEQMYEGTQNEQPGFLNVQAEDYSTASFYRVKVTGGDNEIIIRVPGEDDFDIEPPQPQ